MKQNKNSLSASEQFTISAPLQLQYFMRAYEFLFAAAVVWRSRPVPNSMMSPTLNLECHAIELVLKANLLMEQVDAKSVKNVGHSLAKLWRHGKNDELRHLAIKLERDYSGTESNIIENTILKLSKVYSPRNSKFPLRYETEPDAEAPVPNLAIIIFMTLSRIGIETVIENMTNSRSAKVGRDEFTLTVRDSYYFNIDVTKIFER